MPAVLAFVFPGQGSLRPAMGAPWVDTPSWRLMDRLSDATSRDVGALVLDADAATLQATHNAQIATLALSLVVLDRVRNLGLRPAAVAGHSLGEYTALVAAGALEPDVGASLVEARGAAMQAASDANPGTMAAVLGLDGDEVTASCQGLAAWVANDNAPGQVVVAGTTDGIEAAAAAAKSRGAKRVMGLAVGGAFHSPLMAPAQASLDSALAATRFSDPGLTAVANVDAQIHAEGGEWPGLLSAQLCKPVRWRQSLERLAGLGVSTFVEIGPGDALSGMVRRTLPSATAHAVATPDAVDALAELLG